MNPGVVMIILMLLPNGDLSSSFVNIDTIDECNQRLHRILPILENGDSELQEAGCFHSSMQFNYFDHDPPKDAPRYTFLIDLQPDQATMRKLANPAECRAVLEWQDAPRKYCTTSTQDVTSTAK